MEIQLYVCQVHQLLEIVMLRHFPYLIQLRLSRLGVFPSVSHRGHRFLSISSLQPKTFSAESDFQYVWILNRTLQWSASWLPAMLAGKYAIVIRFYNKLHCNHIKFWENHWLTFRTTTASLFTIYSSEQRLVLTLLLFTADCRLWLTD